MLPKHEGLTTVGGDLDLLAGTLGEWVAAEGNLLVVADLDATLGVDWRTLGSPRLPSDTLADLLVLSRASTVRAAVISRESAGCVRGLVPFSDIICAGLDGREVEGGGLALARHETPAAGWDRARAVLWIRTQVAVLLGQPIKTVYLWASPADETAFPGLAGKAATVRVGPPASDSAATFRLDTVRQARRLLTALARATSRRTVPTVAAH